MLPLCIGVMVRDAVGTVEGDHFLCQVTVCIVGERVCCITDIGIMNDFSIHIIVKIRD